eukprot:TRINITY_DN64509_c0_g1_i1.p2 TRINITY_DN64509_c0_g1~~TRINITY_DN64509_c0_g1_i1.p2  ORF type:complete len:121 (+),score=24.57 TRINITY_DN64509_c0_g1_i1:662-1024(+)
MPELVATLSYDESWDSWESSAMGARVCPFVYEEESESTETVRSTDTTPTAPSFTSRVGGLDGCWGAGALTDALRDATRMGKEDEELMVTDADEAEDMFEVGALEAVLTHSLTSPRGRRWA